MHSESDRWLDALACLGDPVRRRLFRQVLDGAAPVSREEVAEATGVSRSTAAYHLEQLAEAGPLDVRYERRTARTGPGAGRPAKLYLRPAAPIAVSMPHRDIEPRTDAGIVTLRNCPFERLAADHRELVCGASLALVEGVMAVAGAPGERAVLDPGPDRCCVVVVHAA